MLPAFNRLHKLRYHPAPPWQEMPQLYATLAAREAPAAVALRMAILGAFRTSEVLLGVWDEVDLVHRVWVIPPERMKGGRAHRVPLTGPMVELLEGLPRIDDSPYLLPGMRPGRPLSNMAMEMTLRRMGRCDITAHGTARATFKTWAQDAGKYPREAVELCLAHAVQDRTEAAYIRGDALDLRRSIMEDWARFLTFP